MPDTKLWQDRCSDGSIIATFYFEEHVDEPYYETARMEKEQHTGTWHDLHIPIPGMPGRVSHVLRWETHDEARAGHDEAYRLTEDWLAEPERH